MITRNHTEELRNEMMHIENQLSENVETVQKESKLKIKSYDNIEAVLDPLSIDFAPENEAVILIELLVDECVLRIIGKFDKGMEELRDVLKEHLNNEIKS